MTLFNDIEMRRVKRRFFCHGLLYAFPLVCHEGCGLLYTFSLVGCSILCSFSSNLNFVAGSIWCCEAALPFGNNRRTYGIGVDRFEIFRMYCYSEWHRFQVAAATDTGELQMVRDVETNVMQNTRKQLTTHTHLRISPSSRIYLWAIVCSILLLLLGMRGNCKRACLSRWRSRLCVADDRWKRKEEEANHVRWFGCRRTRVYCCSLTRWRWEPK